MPHRTKHPLYTERLTDWQTVRDTLEERAVKDKGVTYLPKTEGMLKTGERGTERYNSYKLRAVVPDVVSVAQAGLVGVAHRKPANIEVPAALDDLVAHMTADGEDIHLLQRRMTAEQLLVGRQGLALRITEAGDLRVATYAAEHMWNWHYEVVDGDNMVDLVVLDQSGDRLQPDGFSWKHKKEYLVLRYSAEDGYTVQAYGEDGPQGEPEGPALQGRPFERLPFVFVGAMDLNPDPGPVPLLPTARRALAIYRGEADYRQTLHEQGQYTLVTKGYGGDDAPPVGSGAWIDVPTDGGVELVGITADGLSEQREALQNDYRRGEAAAVQLLAATSGQAESGEALRQRMAAKTATLTDVVQTGAAALEQILKMAAQLKGASLDEVRVEPNLDFAENTGATRELLELMQAKRLGAPVAQQSLHRFARSRDLTEEDWEDESALIENEGPEDLG